MHPDIEDAVAVQHPFGIFSEFWNDFNRIDAVCQVGQKNGLVGGAGSNFQDMLGPFKLKRLEHGRHHKRL